MFGVLMYILADRGRFSFMCAPCWSTKKGGIGKTMPYIYIYTYNTRTYRHHPQCRHQGSGRAISMANAPGAWTDDHQWRPGKWRWSISSSPIALGTPSLPGWFEKLPRELQRNGRLLEIAREAATMPCIAFDLPAPNLSAGRILEHCVKTIDRIYNKWSPIISKIGWTHNPCFRWGNSLYGYVTEREKWAQMCVLHISHEPFSTAMLEAALIQQFKSILFDIRFQNCYVVFVALDTHAIYIYSLIMFDQCQKHRLLFQHSSYI